MTRALLTILAIGLCIVPAFGLGGSGSMDPPIPGSLSEENSEESDSNSLPPPGRPPPVPPPPSPPLRPPVLPDDGQERDVEVVIERLRARPGERLVVTSGPGAVVPGRTLVDTGRVSVPVEVVVAVLVLADASGLEPLLTERIP